MAGITGQGTTFNLPNFVGELFGITPEDTPFLSAIGGLTGGKSVAAKRFEWEFYDLRAAGQRDAAAGANPSENRRGDPGARRARGAGRQTVSRSCTGGSPAPGGADAPPPARQRFRPPPTGGRRSRESTSCASPIRSTPSCCLGRSR